MRCIRQWARPKMTRRPYADGNPQRTHAPVSSGVRGYAPRRGGSVGLDVVLATAAPSVQCPRPADGDLRLPRNSPQAIFGSQRSMAVINAVAERGGRTDEGVGKFGDGAGDDVCRPLRWWPEARGGSAWVFGACAATAAVWAVSAAPMPIPASMNLVPRTMTAGGRLRRLRRRCGWRQLGLCARRPRWGNQTSSARMLACGVK
jgi:hypothetical protein